VVQVGGHGGGACGWYRWVVHMGGTCGWYRWVVPVGGAGGWCPWVLQVGGAHGWCTWVVDGPHEWSMCVVHTFLGVLYEPA